MTVSSCNVHTCVIPSGKRPSSKHTLIWDKLVGMVKAKEKAVMPSGDAALIHILYNPKNVQVGLQLNVTPLFHAYQAMAGRMAIVYLYLSRVLGAAPIKARALCPLHNFFCSNKNRLLALELFLRGAYIRNVTVYYV